MLFLVTSTTLSYRRFYRAIRVIVGSFAISDIQFQVDSMRIARYVEIAGRSRGFCPAFSGSASDPNAGIADVANKGALICLAISRRAVNEEGRRVSPALIETSQGGQSDLSAVAQRAKADSVPTDFF
jgi:hypothetical protein